MPDDSASQIMISVMMPHHAAGAVMEAPSCACAGDAVGDSRCRDGVAEGALAVACCREKEGFMMQY